MPGTTKPRLTHVLLLAALFITAALAACDAPSESGALVSGSPSAALSPLRQLVEVKFAGSDEWEPVQGTVFIDDGDHVRTSVGGVALLVLSDGTSTEVHPNTILVIEHYEREGNRLDVEMSQLSGQVLNRIEAGRRTNHVLHTPVADVVVHGTVYWSWVSHEDSAKFQVTEGGLEITPGSEDPFTLSSGGCLAFDAEGGDGEDCSGEPAPNPLTSGEPFLEVASLNGPVDLSGCGDGTCDPSVGENRFSCRPDCNQASCGNFICEPEETATTCEQDCVRLGGAICGDDVCQGDSGEDFITCQADCDPPALFCGDGICSDSIGEDLTSCAADCAPLGFCGDGTCNADTGENKQTCSVDCGLPGFCGDDVCQKGLGESPLNCSEDCPASLNCGNGVCESLLDEKDTCPADCKKKNKNKPCGDGVCSADDGEDEDTCPADCAVTVTPEGPCGDGVCDPDDGEDEDTCPADCAVTPEGPCGDGVCDPDDGEDEDTCPADCAVTPEEPCGDGVCSADDGEDEDTCPADCASDPPPDDPPPDDPPPDDPPSDDPPASPSAAADPCGDGVCDPDDDEDVDTCPEDCAAGSSSSSDPCGDGICDPDEGEDEDTCPDDCVASAGVGSSSVALACVQPAEEPVCWLPSLANAPPNPFSTVVASVLNAIRLG